MIDLGSSDTIDWGEGGDYQHELLDVLPYKEVDEARKRAEIIVSQLIDRGDEAGPSVELSETPPAKQLYSDVLDFLAVYPSNIGGHTDDEGFTVQVAVTRNPPNGLADQYPGYLWVRADFFEHDDCFIGVSPDSELHPAFVNFKTAERAEIDSKKFDMLGSTRALSAAIRLVTDNPPQ